MMEATHLNVEVADDELELMMRPASRWHLLPRTPTGWLVGLTLVLCVAGLAAQSSAVSDQLQLYRSHPMSQLRASTATSPDTEVALPLSNLSSSASTSSAERPPDDSSSKVSPEETDAAGSLLSPEALDGDISDSLSTERDATTSEDNTTSSRSSASRTETVSTEAPVESLVHSTGQDETESGRGDHEADNKDEQLRPQPAALLLPGYLPVERDVSLPPQVHALWIGDPSRVAQGLKRYGQMGFEMTIHNSVDDILEGFAPHVRRAYELAIPRVVGFDFLKFLLLYKYGGLVVDADTYPLVFAWQVTYTSECHVLFGKETHLGPWQFEAPTYRKVGGNTYGLTRPYQLLNWAMLAREPRNPHAAALIDGAMRHFYGLRDMEESLVQDMSGSGLMSDYVALLYAEHELDYVAAFNDPAPAASVSAVDGLCILEDELRDGWIHHDFMNTWRQSE